MVVVGIPREIRNQVNMLLNLVGARSLVEALIPGEVYRLELGNGMDLLVTEVDPHDPRYVLEYALGVYGDRVRALLVEPLQPGVE